MRKLTRRSLHFEYHVLHHRCARKFGKYRRIIQGENIWGKYRDKIYGESIGGKYRGKCIVKYRGNILENMRGNIGENIGGKYMGKI